MRFPGKEMKKRVLSILLVIVLLASGIYVGQQQQETSQNMIIGSEQMIAQLETNAETFAPENLKVEEVRKEEEQLQKPVSGFHQETDEDVVVEPKQVIGGQKLPVWQGSTPEISVEEVEQNVAVSEEVDQVVPSEQESSFVQEEKQVQNSLPMQEEQQQIEEKQPVQEEQQVQDGLPNSIGQAAVAKSQGSSEEMQERVVNTGAERYSEILADDMPQNEEVVDFIVVLKEKALLDLFSQQEIVENTSAVAEHLQSQETQLAALETQLEESFGQEEGFQKGFWYTLASTGLSVKTQYKNKEAIENMAGVDYVYMAPVFQAATQEPGATTANAIQMIGADTLNNTGFTGEGMKIAIIDTGIVVDHPSFQALEESKLTESSLTDEKLDTIWETLEASKTSLRQAAYQNSKIPYAFNYTTMDFDVDHDLAGHDHGTHVAGIAAANKVEDTKVVGVAPDAQLFVMQVFDSSGGAGWSTIMAALEDALRLDADVVNLSLGSPAGFADSDPELAAVLKKYESSDTQVLIAGGNDTHNGFMNRTGTDLSKKTNPDNGLVGTPATVPTALAVASTDNEAAEMLYFTVNNDKFGFQDTAISERTNFYMNFRGETLDFVVVGGYGEEKDYIGKDVTDKIAIVNRGETSFQDKQSVAKAKGAKAVIVCNNVPGAFSMLISDGEGHIPCIGISKTDGERLSKLVNGKLTVCEGDMITVQLGKAMSTFSSWGPTPDLKIKPEITGVGGGIYATRDPKIGGSNYGDMSGTSMASPQVAGGIAVLIEYLKQYYPEKTNAELRKLAANLMLSTASQLIESDSLPYSVRNQGAGLVDLEKAVLAGAYLSNPNAQETRPLGEMGDNENGTFTFDFAITNFSKDDETYEFDSIVMAPKLKDEKYMANTMSELSATRVEVTKDGQKISSVTVKAGETVALKASIQVAETDKTELEKYPSGIYVEGYLYAKTPDNADKRDLSMPFLGFYGDWSDPAVFDEKGDDASLYAPVIHTARAQLGINPYIINGSKGDTYNSISYANPLAELTLGMMRNSRKVEFKVTSADGSKTYFTASEENIIKTYFSATYGIIIPYYVYDFNDDILIWDGTDNGSKLPDGTKAHYIVSSYLDDGDDVVDDTFEFDVTIDNTKPVIKDADSLAGKVQKDSTAGTVKLPITVSDNHYIAAVMFESPEGIVLGRYQVKDQVPGQEQEVLFDVSGYGSNFTVIVADYAMNEVEAEVEIDLSDMPLLTEPKKLDKNRIYGNETYNIGPVSQGWFSAEKETFTGLRNETYDTYGTSYSGEFVNGYVVSQRASDGALLLYTPYNTYWSARTLLTQPGKVGDDGFKVLYDMAMDYTTDRLFAIGWEYKGDTDGDGKDNGANTLFEIKFSGENISIDVVKKVEGLGTLEGLTLGCDDKGQLYTISGDGKLYQLDKETGTTTYVGTTSFVAEELYGGVNVIQSMGYDHNTNEMYWYAHSQVSSAGTYINLCKTYKVDLTDGSCTEVGSAGQSGHTSLFIPNDKETTLFEMNVDATGFEVSERSITLAKGQTRRISVVWKPWNAEEQNITWDSENENIATVSSSGQIKAIESGKTTVTATAELPNGDEAVVEIEVEVVGGSGNLYGFVITDYRNSANETSWITYSDSNPEAVTNIKKDSQMWQGGTYYNGKVYVVVAEKEPFGETTTSLYSMDVTPNHEDPTKTTIGSPKLIGSTKGIEVGNIAFDYSTARMYGVDYTNGGLCIIDIENGGIDLMGTFQGDLEPAIMPAMCVTDTGRIIGSDMFGALYEVDPDTMQTTKIGSIPVNTFYYAGMTFDHNTKTIYWNPCMAEGASNLYMIRLKSSNPQMESDIQIIDLGAVSSEGGVEQTAMFTIPVPEPETHYVEIEKIDIIDGGEDKELVGLIGGVLQLTTQTAPKRPSISSKTWESSNPEVAEVDNFGKLTYKSVGETDITVSVRGKAEGNEGPFTDTITVKVYESADDIVAFLGSDEEATFYYDYWLDINDYDLLHTRLTGRMIDVYSLRTGEYYDGYFYAYNDKGELCRINAKNYSDNVVIANHGLGTEQQIVSMAFHYDRGLMYALTLPEDSGKGNLATIDLTTGKVEIIAETSASVNTLAVDKNGTMYAAGSPAIFETAILYTIDPETAECTELTTIDGALAYTGPNYMWEIMYNPQMTYDHGTNRLYFYATSRHKTYKNHVKGMYLIQLKEDGEGKQTVDWYENLGKIALQIDPVEQKIKLGNAYLGLLCSIPKVEELPEAVVTGVRVSRSTSRLQVGDESQLSANVMPSNSLEQGIRWESKDESIVEVSDTGRLLAVGAGKTEVWAISTANENIKGICTVTVSPVPESKDTTVGYTISADQEALMAFNPEFPASTARKVATLSGGKNVEGVTLKGSDYLYYMVYSSESIWPQLYRYDLNTKQRTSMGELYVYVAPPADLAYDPVHDLIYVASGFYIFQFQEDKLQSGTVNNYSAIVDLTKTEVGIAETQAVTCIDGEVYVMVSDNQSELWKLDDHLKNPEFVRSVDVNTMAGESQMDYDSRTGYFYISDAGERLWRFTTDPENKAELMDVFGYGWDMNGIALDVQLGEVPGEVVPEPDPEQPENPPVEETITIKWKAEPEISGVTEGSGSYKAGDIIRLMATEVEGYDFLGWYDGEEQISTDLVFSYQVKESDNNKILIAKYQEKEEPSQPGEGGDNNQNPPQQPGGNNNQNPPQQPGGNNNQNPPQQPGGNNTQNLPQQPGGNNTQNPPQQPEGNNSQNPVQKPNHTMTEEEIKEALKPGKTFESPDGIYQFRIKNASEAIFTGVRIPIPTVKIANEVTYLGKKFKVTSVAKNALKGEKKLKTLYVGANITEIGKSAFENCTKLKKVSLGKKTIKIQEKALKGCKSLIKITIPKNVTTIGKSAFEGCKKLATIKINSKKLKTVQKNAFKNINKNAKVKVPKKQLSKYKKLLKNKGFAKKVVIR